MTKRTRQLLVLGLTATAGSLDAWSYFGLAHVFIANMTGNTVMVGYATAIGDWRRSLDAGGAILFYGVGVILGSLLTRSARRAVQTAGPDAVLWPARVTVLLGIELALLLPAALFAAAQQTGQGDILAHVFVFMGAIAIGLQSAAVTTMHLQGIATTFVTGTWTTVDAGIALLLAEPESRQETREKRQLLAMQSLVLLVYAAGAAGGGVWMRLGGRTSMGLLPVGLLTLVLAGARLTQRRSG